jgi:Flp pilus assembly secretin CpaC
VIAILRACVLGAAFLLMAESIAQASDQTITLRLGASSRFVLERAFETVLIGDPDVVDVHTTDERSVILEPLNPGVTDLIFMDAESAAITNVRILVGSADAI